MDASGSVTVVPTQATDYIVLLLGGPSGYLELTDPDDRLMITVCPATGCATAVEGAYSVYKFNLDPADDFTGLRDWVGANSVQLAEITLFGSDGEALRDGLVCTNPGGDNPAGELPEHACNGLTENDPAGCSGCRPTRR